MITCVFFVWQTFVSSAVAELITIGPVYVCPCVCISVFVCLLATDMLENVLDNS